MAIGLNQFKTNMRLNGCRLRLALRAVLHVVLCAAVLLSSPCGVKQMTGEVRLSDGESESPLERSGGEDEVAAGLEVRGPQRQPRLTLCSRSLPVRRERAAAGRFVEDGAPGHRLAHGQLAPLRC